MLSVLSLDSNSSSIVTVSTESSSVTFSTTAGTSVLSCSVVTASSVWLTSVSSEAINPPLIFSVFSEYSSIISSVKKNDSVWLLKFKLNYNLLIIDFLLNNSSPSIGFISECPTQLDVIYLSFK